jgi:hypothetical protein
MMQRCSMFFNLINQQAATSFPDFTRYRQQNFENAASTTHFPPILSKSHIDHHFWNDVMSKTWYIKEHATMEPEGAKTKTVLRNNQSL